MNNKAYVKTEIKDNVATVEFFHPAHNSLPGEILSQLTNAISVAGKDDTVKVIILKSGGDRTFCAGASFDELAAIQDADTGKKFFMGFANVINACRTCGKLIIGRVQGKAVGGGVGLASAVDYCFATKYAAVKLSELAIGIGPFVVGPAVKRKTGLSAFSQMAIDASAWQSPEWAQEKGLFNEVLQDIPALDARIETFAHWLAQQNPYALNSLKSIFWEGTEHWEQLLSDRAAISGELVLSEFTRNAIRKIKGK